jgi:dihydroorotase (multifunctional complex type)
VKADLLLRNGTIVSPHGRYCADIAVDNGLIAAIVRSGTRIEAKSVVDAAGKCVLPGIWHPHCHFRDPGMTHKEDFESGSRCAVAGGITFIIDMTNNEPPPATVETFLAKKQNAERKSVVDFALYGAGLIPEQVQPLAAHGAIGIKVFNTRHVKGVYPYMDSLGVVDHGLLYEIYEQTAKTGLVCAVHHDDPDWTKRLVHRDYIDKGRIDSASYIDAYQKGYMYGHGMISGLASSLYLAKLAGVRLYVLHTGVMPVEHYDLIAHARQNGQQIYSELEASAILIPRDMAERIGPRMCQFSAHPDEAWEHIRSGQADVVVFEHAPHHADEIARGWQDNFSAPLGMIGAQEFLPMMLNEVNKGSLSLEKLVALCSENPARIFSVYPRKGAIQVGSDADFTIVDMARKKVLSDADSHSRSGWTTFDGIEVTGVPTHTIIRGTVACEEGIIKVPPGFGTFVPGVAART